MSKIERIEAVILDMPTIRGHVLSMTTMTVQSVVLARVFFADGSIGLGEGASIGGLSYGPESVESIKSAIDHYIAPALVGMEGDGVNAATAHLEKAVRGNPIARSAVEMALWDGFGKRSLSEDMAHVGAIVKAVGERSSIRVDVNQSWSLTQARQGARALQDMGVDLIEQPIIRHDLAGMRALTEKYEIAIMADEALQGPGDAAHAAQERAADVFAVKICQSGGLKGASDVIAIGRAAGIGLYAGTMLESGLGTAAALQLFATVPDIAWGGELFGPLLLREDILAEPLRYSDFSVEIPHGPGFGVALDEDKVNFFRRDSGRKTARAAE